jgi:hypothetical protein
VRAFPSGSQAEGSNRRKKNETTKQNEKVATKHAHTQLATTFCFSSPALVPQQVNCCALSAFISEGHGFFYPFPD